VKKKETSNIHIAITGDSAKLQQATKKARKSANSLGEGLGNLTSAVGVIDGPLGGITGRVSALRTALTRTNVVMGAAGVSMSALTAATAAGLRQFSATEQSLFKTEAILNATGMASGFTATQMDAMARATARATLASTDQIRAAQQVLLTFRSVSGPTFQRTIDLAQDMAATFGGDARTAATQLGKALEDPITGLTSLRRSGISFSESQKQVIKSLVETGNKAEAQRKILNALEGQVGGAGRAESKGLAGSFDTLRQASFEAAEEWVKLIGLGPKLTKINNELAGSLDAAADAMRRSGTIEGQKEQLKVLRDQLKVAKRINQSGAGGELFGTGDIDADSIKERIFQKELLIAKLYEQGLAEDNLAVTSQKRSVAVQEQIALEDKAAEAARINAEKIKEFRKVQESLLNRTDQEKQTHLTRIAQFEELALANQNDASLKKQINSAIETEELRHVERMSEIRRLDRNKRNEGINKASEDDQALVIDVGKIRESFLTAAEIENKYHEERQARLEMFREKNPELRNSINLVLEQEKARHEEKLTSIEEDAANKRKRIAAQEMQARFDVMNGMYTNLSSLMNTHSRRAFKIGKIAAISSAIVAGIEAGVHSYNAGAEIGGPVLGAAFAATAAVATGTQIQNLRRQQFGGGGSVTGIGGGAVPVISEPVTPVNPVSSGGGTNIYIQNVNGGNAAALVDELRDVISNNDYFIIDPSSANARAIRGDS